MSTETPGNQHCFCGHEAHQSSRARKAISLHGLVHVPPAPPPPETSAQHHCHPYINTNGPRRQWLLKCQRYGGTYLGGLTEDVWILSPPGPKRGWGQPREGSGGKRPQRPQPLSQAAHLHSPPGGWGSPGLSGVPWQLWARAHHTGSRGCLRSPECGARTRAAPRRRPHAHQHPSPGFWRPGSPTRGLRTHTGRLLGLAGLWHPNRHSTSVWKISPSQTCGLAFALKQLLHRLQASPCSGYLCLWFQTIPGYSETHLQAWSFQVRLSHPSSVWLMYGSVLTAIPPPVKQHS